MNNNSDDVSIIKIIFVTLLGSLGSAIPILWAFAPLYAAYRDFQNGDLLLAVADYILFPLGIVRSLIFAFG